MAGGTGVLDRRAVVRLVSLRRDVRVGPHVGRPPHRLAVTVNKGESTVKRDSFKLPLVAIALGLCCLVASPSAVGSENWWILDELPALDSAGYWDGGTAWGINEAGDVVGESAGHAVLWRDGQAIDLTPGKAVAISDAGDVIGNAGMQYKMFLYRAGSLQTWSGTYVDTCPDGIGRFPQPSGDYHDISGPGAIAGTAWVNPTLKAFASSASAFPVVETLTDVCDPYTEATIALCISDAGHIGGYRVEGEIPVGFIYKDGNWTRIEGFQGNYGTYVEDVNSSGVLVGSCSHTSAPILRAFVHTGGQLQSIPLANGGRANAVNDRGQVVGFYYGADSGRGFLYENGVVTDLNSLIDPALGWLIVEGNDINESGEIVGRMYSEEHGIRAFRMRPPAPVDSDDDGLSDAQELVLGTDPNDSDTDGDGLLDGTEVEMAAGSGCPSPLDADSDDDYLSDGEEVGLGTSPCDADTDDDGAWDDLDPSPLEAGATASELEEWATDLSSEVFDLPTSIVAAPNANAGAGRLHTLAVKIRAAGKALSLGHSETALNLLASVRGRLDGESNPEDWLAESLTQDALLREIDALMALISE
jgi:probable HAF family extracellular repeat protein